MSSSPIHLRRNLAAFVEVSARPGGPGSSLAFDLNVRLVIPTLGFTYSVGAGLVPEFVRANGHLSTDTLLQDAAYRALNVSLDLLAKEAPSSPSPSPSPATAAAPPEARIQQLEADLADMTLRYDRLLCAQMGVLHDHVG